MVLLNQSSALKAASAAANAITSAAKASAQSLATASTTPVAHHHRNSIARLSGGKTGPAIAVPPLPIPVYTLPSAPAGQVAELPAEDLRAALARERELAGTVRRGRLLAALREEAAACRAVLQAAAAATTAAVDAAYAADDDIDADVAGAAAAAVVPFAVLYSPTAGPPPPQVGLGAAAASAAPTPTATSAPPAGSDSPLLRARMAAGLPPPAVGNWGLTTAMTPREEEPPLKDCAPAAAAENVPGEVPAPANPASEAQDAIASPSVEAGDAVATFPTSPGASAEDSGGGVGSSEGVGEEVRQTAVLPAPAEAAGEPRP